jgi:hypothetical protein
MVFIDVGDDATFEARLALTVICSPRGWIGNMKLLTATQLQQIVRQLIVNMIDMPFVAQARVGLRVFLVSFQRSTSG